MAGVAPPSVGGLGGIAARVPCPPLKHYTRFIRLPTERPAGVIESGTASSDRIGLRAAQPPQEAPHVDSSTQRACKRCSEPAGVWRTHTQAVKLRADTVTRGV
jgi:hypothetical protein